MSHENMDLTRTEPLPGSGAPFLYMQGDQPPGGSGGDQPSPSAPGTSKPDDKGTTPTPTSPPSGGGTTTEGDQPPGGSGGDLTV